MGVSKLRLLLFWNFWCLYIFKSTLFGTCDTISYSFQKDFSNGILHTPIGDHFTLTLKGFVVKSQIEPLAFLLIITQWIIWRHFRHLHFKTFTMVSWGPNLVFFYLFNEGSKHLGLLYECNSQNESALRSHWVQSFTLSPICESVFHIWTHSLGLMSFCTLHLVANPMLGVWHLWSIQ
jgi:hypothetical protein